MWHHEGSASLIDTKSEDFDFVMAVNLYGPFRVTQAFAPLIMAQKGRIVTIGSINGILAGGGGFCPYCMSKHAMEAFTDSLAAEMRPHGVQVSIIEPGGYRSEIGKKAAARAGKDPSKMDSSEAKGPDDVALAVEQALFEAVPKRRYLVVPEQRMTV